MNHNQKSNTQSLYNIDADQLIVSHVITANNFFTRLKGLMFCKSLAQDSALLIKPCQQIHTHFMHFPIDVLFLNNQLEVVHVIREMKPWRFSKYIKQASFVIETNAGVSHSVEVGHRLKFATP